MSNWRKYLPTGGEPWIENGGRPARAFQRFITQLTASPGAIASPTVGASPWAYTASESGNLHIRGGTVSAVTITRAAIVLTTGLTAGFFPVGLGDIVTVTYSVLPTVRFVPD